MPGKLDLRWTPWIREPLAQFGEPKIGEVTICSAAQVAKTTFVFVAMGWTLDQQPGPIMFVMPNRDMANKTSKERFKPFLEDCPRLARLIPRNKDLYANLEMTLTTASVMLIGSNSPSNLASFPIRYLFLDETDKFAEASDKESSAVALAVKRIRTYTGSKIVRTSTPTVEDGEIWRALKNSDWRRFFVPCPACGHMQTLDWANVVWPADAKAKDGRWDLERVQAETRYRCANGKCQTLIDNGKKRWMVARGQWRATQTGKAGHAGYHISALYALWDKCHWGTLAVEWLEAQPYPDKVQDFINSTLAEPWRVKGRAASQAEILAHVADYPAGSCPAQPYEVILTVDKQEFGFWYVVRAWGQNESSWKIRHGFCATFAEVAAIAGEIYAGPTGPLAITRRFIDSGDDTVEVYRWAAANGFLPWKGTERSRSNSIYKLATLKTGVILFEFQSDTIKDLLQAKLRIGMESGTFDAGQPGAWCLDAETGLDYADHLTAEERRLDADKFGAPQFSWYQIRKDNHLLDCEVAQLAIAMFLGVRFKGQTGRPPPPARGGHSDVRTDAALGDGPKRSFRRLQPRKVQFFRRRS